MIGVVARKWFSETHKLAPRYKFFAAGTKLINQS
jgi:hypothetical protein